MKSLFAAALVAATVLTTPAAMAEEVKITVWGRADASGPLRIGPLRWQLETRNRTVGNEQFPCRLLHEGAA